jgi:pyruvate dehydrogenase E2 component (dihydrolipoamide acetyltransferase)
MAKEIVMPKMGNSVESCILVEWKKKVGDPIAVDEILCVAETDKATVDVESTEEGTVLAILHKEGDDVPVMTPIAVIGKPGEAIPDTFAKPETTAEQGPQAEKPASAAPAAKADVPAPTPERVAGGSSPRARNLAFEKGIPLSAVSPSGPKGRIIERDVSALVGQPLSPAAREMALAQGAVPPATGSGPGGRVLRADLQQKPVAPPATEPAADETTVIPVAGVRKVTARRMMESMHQTCQLTLNTAADARVLKRLRAAFKASGPDSPLYGITIGDLVLFAVTRTLQSYPAFNAHFLGDRIVRYEQIHMGLATDTPRGLLVPVIRNAGALSLASLSKQSKAIAERARTGKSDPDELKGSTFTVTNVGSMGVESFTPVLNIPEVAILGVGTIYLKPVEESDGKVAFLPHIGLSLTIDHQAVDGADGARFLRDLSKNIATVDLLLAI